MSSTRLKLLIVGIVLAVAREVAAAFDVHIDPQAFLSVEGLILGLMGLDTARPLGRGYPPEIAAPAEAPEEAPAE